MKRVILLFLLVTSMSSSLLAQWEFGFGAIGLAPVDRFDSSVYKPGAGVFLNLTTKSFLDANQPWQLRFGFYMDYLNAGKEKFDVMLADPINEEGEIEFKNFNVGHHLFTRFGYQVNNRVTIFTDGIIGHRRFTSQTTTGVKGYSEEYEDDIEKIHSYRTFRYGVGFGTRIALKPALGLEFRADYTRGDNATYFDMNSIKETSTSFEYDEESWPHTDLFIFGVAVNWKLFKIETTESTSSKTNTNSYTPAPTYQRSSPRTNTRTKTKKKKTVTPTKDIKKKEEKKKEEEIRW